MKKVATFGEIMLRLAPVGYNKLFQNDRLVSTFGGGEANVAVSLANFGVECQFVSKVPADAIGQGAINSLRYFGVDTTHILRGGERLGIYFVEKGASQRPSVCIYDRHNSALLTARREEFCWREILRDVGWFHFTGITPALGTNVYEICLDAVKMAKELGIGVSCDLNFRSKLWSRESAKKCMSELCRYVDVCIANEEDAYDVFGINAIDSDIIKGQIDDKGYEYVAKSLLDMFDFNMVAITLRTSISASDNDWSAVLYDGKDFYHAPTYHLRIVDRVGGGDSFGAGLIYGILNDKSPQDALNFAVAASALKHSVEGDFNRVSVEDVERLASGDGSGRVRR